MQGNLSRLAGILNGVLPLLTSDRASSSSNTWTDGASVDAHAYSGYVYDFYFKRFNRRGLDGNNLRILSFVHPLNRQDCIATFSQNASPGFIELFSLQSRMASGDFTKDKNFKQRVTAQTICAVKWNC